MVDCVVGLAGFHWHIPKRCKCELSGI